MLLAYSLHQLAYYTNENHNYIAYLFISQTADADSSFDYLNYFLEQKLKKSKKNKLFVLSLKLNFQWNWNWRLRKIKGANSHNSFVNSDNRANFGVAPNSSSPRSSFVSSEIDTWYCHLPVCPAEQPTGRMEGEGAFHDKKHFFKCSWTMTYSLCLKYLLPTCYSLLNVLIMSFLIYISALDFILLDGADISSNTSYFKSFWVFNKFFKY